MDAKKILTVIGFLFAVNCFGQTWDIQTGEWLAPNSDIKNKGVKKSLQIGDGVGTDSLVGASTGTRIYFPYSDGFFKSDILRGWWKRDTIYLSSNDDDIPTKAGSLWQLIDSKITYLTYKAAGEFAGYVWGNDSSYFLIASASNACTIIQQANELSFLVKRDSTGGEGDLIFSIDHEGIKSSNDLAGGGEYMLFDRSGQVTISLLGGGGTQMVTADNNGLLAVQAIPTSSPDSLAISGDTLSIIGSNSVILPASAGALFSKLITSGATITMNAYGDTTFFINNTGAAVTYDLPASPANNEIYYVKDGGQNSATYNITVDGNGNDIDGSATHLINTNGASRNFMYNSTLDEWVIW